MSFYHLAWIDPNIGYNNNEIKYIIKFIIIMDELIDQPDDKILEILKKFQHLAQLSKTESHHS